ncbi:MAG: ABC-type transport auxiliary lipoprotein family protein [Noviherbaspirillum sp.]
MKKIIPLLAAMSVVVAITTGCAVVGKQESATLYDLGPLRAKQANQAGTLPALPPISIADIGTPAWLDSRAIYFRLNYANEQQPRPYAESRWTMTPAQLLSQHLKSRIAYAGGVALSTSDGALDVPVLRIDADDFTQNFDAPGQSNGQVDLRASVFKGRKLVAQKTFVRQAPAPSADAAGGTKALAAASDAVLADLIAWLGTLDLK